MGLLDALARLGVGILFLILAMGLAACQSHFFLSGNYSLRLTRRVKSLTIKVEKVIDRISESAYQRITAIKRLEA
jgi:hypothetical protein